MINCIFTIDYEIYGNGEGSLRDLVYEPAERLKAIFRKWNARFVLFVEVAELEMINAMGTDEAIHLVKDQVQDFYNEGFELGLHLHPQWYNGRFENGKWLLDDSEYNLCLLSRERISQIIDRSIAYLRKLLGVPDFTPFSFRAGNWLFQPTGTVAKTLVEQGIKIDSSVFKGGLQHQRKLDYRRALKNGYYWPFDDNVNVSDPQGALVELPIYTKMVPIWKLLTVKRVGLQRKGPSNAHAGHERMFRIFDFLRFHHPMKFDFCRMTLKELMHMLDQEIREDQRDPAQFRPLVGIGHTKDLMDFETIDSLLSYLRRKDIKVASLSEVYHLTQGFSENVRRKE